MFRQRTSSQKPGDELLATFKQQFPEVAAATSSSSSGAPASTATAGQPAAVAVTSLHERPHSLSHEAFRDQDPTPRASNEPWRFTPSLLDSSSFSFAQFTHQPAGYYTPTPGGTNTLYHSQAGDLQVHTPSLSLGMGLGTPLSMPTADGTLHSGATAMDLSGFHHGFPQHQFPNYNPFIQAPPPQPSFAPSSFVHQDTGYETMDQDGSPVDSDGPEERMGSIDGNFSAHSPMMGYQSRSFGMPMTTHLPPSAGTFRFHTTLNAPTAMIRHADEIPVTYLNKGQAYSLSVVDTRPSLPVVPGQRFRTFVRISFEDEQQRLKPGVCWSLWKEGRGTSEAHQRGGKLQAVEYVEAGQPAEGDDKRTRVEIETSSFDGFSVIWTPGINGSIDCSIAVRFNFLSTDFSHSKGVKGIPVRLCAKTHPLPLDSAQPLSPETSSEVCYCKVKLFRDHGAERKLSNDVAHVRKSIEKLNQQIAQAESGMKDFGKRKRAGATQVKGQGVQRPGKVQKHKRTWSMSSASSAGGGPRLPAEEDLQFKLRTLQDMFTSTRPVSVLYLRGEDFDDPDLHPVSLPGESLDLSKIESKESTWRSEQPSVAGSSLVSPSPSSLSLHSQASVTGSKSRWKEFQRMGSDPSTSSDQPTRVKQKDESGKLTGWIEALGVDSGYRPPPETSTKPVACFYLAQEDSSNPSGHRLHRAVYLMQRTVQEFAAKVGAKFKFDGTRVARTVRVLPRGLEIEIDDEVMHEIPEGQDMVFEVAEVRTPVKREWEMAVDDGPEETDMISPISTTADDGGYELRLRF